VAGYSGTPLPKKLGIKEGAGLTVLNPPDDYPAALGELPSGVRRVGQDDRPDVLLFFTTSRAELAGAVEGLGQAVFPSGSLWVAWPKRASGVPTDLTEDALRELALPLGLVDNKVCAIDETWSGLRLVWRKELRG